MERRTNDPLERVVLDGQEMFCIRNVHDMRPFLMTVVSATDHWMFVSSLGGLTAGRVRPENCAFPYETEDRLHRAAGATGPMTLLRVQTEDLESGGARSFLWEPFTASPHGGAVTRNLYKSPLGDRLVFEEVHSDLGLTFRYRWASSGPHGLIRTATLEAHEGRAAVHVRILDGLLNIMPAGVDLTTWQSASCLVDAYRRNEVDPVSGLAIYALEAKISDRTDPAEALTATVVWSHGLLGERHLDPAVVECFRRDETLAPRLLTTGQVGAYLTLDSFALEPGGSRSWHQIIDVSLDHAAITRIAEQLRHPTDWDVHFERAIDSGTAQLVECVARADGLQCTADRTMTAHHRLNVLFNNMRGGVFADGEYVGRDDFLSFLRVRHRPTFQTHEGALALTPARWRRAELLAWLIESGDDELCRLGLEYLPLTFGRRHGDPSRPWNTFEINVLHADGSQRLDYQGNWRDVFQNWEALLYSHPGFIEHAVARFVNASTVDGFNPYRIFRDGFEWEIPEPEHPWSNIGYWGDHQIVYLLQLLDAWRGFEPHALDARLTSAWYSYADVPYRLASYSSIVANPKHTVSFDVARQRTVEARVEAVGTDGRLIHGADGHVLLVTLAEKLLVPLLSKLSNFVPDGGVWMNTQRPEWNDANNALVGYGVSMVTAFHVRRYLRFLIEIFGSEPSKSVSISTEVVDWLFATRNAFDRAPGHRDDAIARRAILDALGQAFSTYRERVYEGGLTARCDVAFDDIVGLCRLALTHVDATLRGARRPDGLFHSYSLLDLSSEGALVSPLGEMLEGQVAALGAGVLETGDALTLVSALYQSGMYRPDQRSFMLYPFVPRPAFMERNVVPAEAVGRSPLLSALMASNDRRLLIHAADGRYRFSHTLSGTADVERTLASVAGDGRFAALVAAHGDEVLALYSDVFGHRAFTGRSGTMYKYEGLGCIYWHMVSKLLVAVADCAVAARDRGEPVQALVAAWHTLRAGLGVAKTPREFGAFPLDPYSHTPAHLGAQQPGMTGQAKEGVLMRLGELGVRVRAGSLRFDPFLLRHTELLTSPERFVYYDARGEQHVLEVPAGALAFTFCQVPVMYRKTTADAELHVVFDDGTVKRLQGRALDAEMSRSIFERRAVVARIEVLCSELAG